MKRLFSKFFEKNFTDYKIAVVVSKLGALEFSEIRKKYAKDLQGMTPNLINDLQKAITENDSEKLLELQNALGVDFFNAFESFSNDMVLTSIVELKIDDEEFIPIEAFNQLQLEEIKWISERFADVNKGLFDTKKKV